MGCPVAESVTRQQAGILLSDEPARREEQQAGQEQQAALDNRQAHYGRLTATETCWPCAIRLA